MKSKVDFLEWDSSFFGLRIGKAIVSTQEELEELSCMRDRLCEMYDLIYIFTNNDSTSPLPGSILVDRKVVYSMEVAEPSRFDGHIEEYKDPFVSEDLLKLALASGEYSRYKLDKQFPQNSYERLYTRWIEQSVNHAIANEVFCYLINGSPKGLITLKHDNNYGDIGLVATDSECRGMGLGSAMLRHVKHYLFTKGGRKLNVATQYDNKAACHLYEKAGFIVSSCTNVWHWWLNKSN